MIKKADRAFIMFACGCIILGVIGIAKSIFITTKENEQ